MPQEDPRYAAYLAALTRHGQYPVRLETTVADLLVITSALQLALRHPGVGQGVRASVTAFLAGAFAGVEALDPVLGAVARLGDDPRFDVAADARHA